MARQDAYSREPEYSPIMILHNSAVFIYVFFFLLRNIYDSLVMSPVMCG